MANQTEERDNTHGESAKKPLFGPGSDPSDPRGPDNVAAGKSSDPRGESSINSRGLGDAEPLGGIGSRGKVGTAEAGLTDQLGKGFTGGAGAALGGGNTLRRIFGALARNKKKTIGGIVGGGIVTGLIFLFNVAQGPLTFIHFAQSLQNFHLGQNEDFMGDRGNRVLIYKLIGWGGERGRMGVVLNKAADAYEKRMLKNLGVRPIYTERTSRFAGYQIVDEKKAKPLTDFARSNGYDVRRIRAETGGQGYVGPRGDQSVNAGNQRAVFFDPGDYSGSRRLVDYAHARGFNTKIFGAMAGRLEKKRGGIKWHLFESKGIKRQLDTRGDDAADRERLRKLEEEFKVENNKRFASYVKSGVKGLLAYAFKKKSEDTNNDGKVDENDSSPQSDEVKAEAEKVFEEVNSGSSDNPRINIQSVLRTGLSATAITGVLCAAKSLGNQQEQFKYEKNILPTMRMGSAVVSWGSQTQSMNVNADELGVFAERFYDSEKKTSFSDANTYRMQGNRDPIRTKDGRYDTPPEAEPSTATEKSKFFQALDAISPLGFACDLQEGFFNLPGVKQITGAIDAVTGTAINAALAPFGTDKDKLVEGALAAISGDTVNTYARGAEFGNLSNIGTFLLGNDIAIAGGGRLLNDDESLVMQLEREEKQKTINNERGFAQRYFNIYDSTSLVGTMISSLPTSTSSLLNEIKPAGIGAAFSSLSNLVSPTAYAEQKYTPMEIYGLHKAGFSKEEQNDKRFEVPYINMDMIDKKPGKLDQLNEKYGKCFSMKVIRSGSQISLDYGEAVDPNKLEKGKKGEGDYKACFDGSEDLLRYRYYIADTLAEFEAACLFADDTEACTQLGIQSSGTGEAGPTETVGATIDMEHLYESSVDIACAPGTKDIGVQDGYTEGKKVKIRVCGVTSVPETGGTSPLSGADGKLLVNSRLSAFYVKLVEDAKNDGIGSITAQEGFRTMKQQECFYAGGCGATGAAAQPGYSNHQMGLAVDWGDSMVGWLNENGNRYGLKALVSGEPWHWSPTGN